MGMVNFTIKMVASIKDNGNITKWMVQVNYIINLINQHMKVNGKMINFMDMVQYIINNMIC